MKNSRRLMTERPDLPADVQEQVDINIKYDGYIKRQLRQVEQFKKMENKKNTGLILITMKLKVCGLRQSRS